MASDYRNQPNLPRGIRNNNPGNIKADGTNWQGAAGDDGTFIIFSDMSWGTRALAQALANMIRKGNNTITGIISQWAPSSDNNNVQAYINAVAADTGIDPSQPLTMDVTTLGLLCRGIINHENGESASSTYVSDQDITDGIDKMNNSLLSLFQAGVVAAQQNPDTAIGIAIGIGVIVFLLFRRNRVS